MHKILVTSLLLSCFASIPAGADDVHYGPDDFYHVDKIDSHMHLHGVQPAFMREAQRDHFRVLSINVDYADFPPLGVQQKVARHMHRKYPATYGWVMTFSVKNFDQPGWAADVIRQIDAGVKHGAVGVKVWKNIGMSLRDAQGKMIMIDDPHFTPIFDHLEKIQLPLLGHQGEPKNCWLPMNEMIVKGDREYFAAHPQYYMYLHPELPSYDDQMRARDAMVERHPDLIFVGMHMASLEWSVDELAKFLDRFPRASVDLAARIGQLQYQLLHNREKVEQFLINYQDRLTYGTDLDQEINDPTFAEQARRVWLRDWQFFTSGDTLTVPDLDQPVQSLALPKSVVDKIYSKNAERLYPHAWLQK